MDCKDPKVYQNTRPSGYEGELADWREELLCRHADGQTDEAFRSALSKHIRNCALCRAALEQYQLLNKLASKRYEMIRLCPSASILDSFAFHPETLDAAAVRKLQQHLEGCESCREDIAWLRSQPKVGSTPVFSSRWRPILSAAAAILLIIAAFWVIQVSLKARAVANLTAMAELPRVELSEVETLPQLQNPADQTLYEDAVKLVQQSRFEEASAILRGLNPKDPGQLRVLFLLAYSYGRSGDLRQASDAVAKIRTCRPGSAPRCWYLANLLIKVHNWDRARTELDHVLTVDPGNERARQLKERLQRM